MKETSRLDSRQSGLLAGIFLAASFLTLLIALGILFASGASSVFSATLQGSLAEMAPFAGTFRTLNLLWVAAWILQLLGFSLLSYNLQGAGAGLPASVGFTAILAAAIIGVLHGTFHMSVETWAAQEAARTGSVPIAFEPLDIWVGAFFRAAYVLHLVGTGGIGWALIRAERLPNWVGAAVILWSLLWLAGYLVGAGLPAVLFLMPAFVGLWLIHANSRIIRGKGNHEVIR